VIWQANLSSLCRPQHHGSTPKGTPLNFSRNRSGVWKNWLLAYKISNISETVEDGAKVTINDLYKVVYGLSIAAKIYDLELPLSETQDQ